MKPLIASGLQAAIERLVLEMAGEGENPRLAGGLGLNALLVASLERSGKWRNVFVQPAAGNSGTARAPLTTPGTLFMAARRARRWKPCRWGPATTPEQIKQVLENCKLRFHYHLTTEELLRSTVDQLAAEKIVAWMQGRMEFGSRALGIGPFGLAAEPVPPRPKTNVFIKHRAPVPRKLRGIRAHGIRRPLLRRRPECALSGPNGGPRERRASQDV